MAVNRKDVGSKQQENHKISGKKDWQRPELSILSADQTDARTGNSPEFGVTTRPS